MFFLLKNLQPWDSKGISVDVFSETSVCRLCSLLEMTSQIKWSLAAPHHNDGSRTACPAHTTAIWSFYITKQLPALLLRSASKSCGGNNVFEVRPTWKYRNSFSSFVEATNLTRSWCLKTVRENVLRARFILRRLCSEREVGPSFCLSVCFDECAF